MQAVLEQKQSGLVFFARRRNRDYMMRSEKRPNYNRAQFDPGRNRRPKKRRRTSHAYLIFTFIISVLLWPLGLFLIWNRRMRCKAGGKLVWSLVTLILFSALIFALLTFPTRSEKFQAFQDDANDFFATVWADTRIVAETVADRTEDAWTNMRLFVDSAQAPVRNALADGLETCVEWTSGLRETLSGLFDGGEDVSSPDLPSASVEPDASASVAPSASENPSASPEPSASRKPSASPRTAGRSSASPSDSVETQSPSPTRKPIGRASDSASTSPDPTATKNPVSTSSVAVEASSTATLSSRSAAVRAGTSVSATSSPTPSPSPSPSPSPLPSQTPFPANPNRMASDTSTLRISAEATPVPTLKPAGAFLVYHTPHGKWYHTEEHCSGMLGASQYTLESAVANGKKTCSVCSAPSSELLEEPYVVWVDENQVYHVSDECADFSGKASLMTPDTAAREGCAPCERCGAAAYSPEALASLSDVSSTEEAAMSTPEASASADAQQPSPSAQTGDSH